MRCRTVPTPRQQHISCLLYTSQLTVRGLQDNLNNVDAGTITPHADLSALIDENGTVTAGEQEVTVKFLLPASVEQVNAVTVQVLSLIHISPFDIQVLTPMRKGSLGVETLNGVLQSCLNPPSEGKKEVQLGDTLFREGDKVMQIKNNYQLEWEVVSRYGIPIDKGVGIFNGDMGIIREIDEYAQTVLVEYDEQRRVTYTYPQMEEVELAYAITIHKSQGSEYPAVIMPLLGGPRLLFNRNLLYTGVTRARAVSYTHLA